MHHLLALALAVLGPSGSAPTTENMASAELFVRTEGSDVRVAIRIEVERGWHIFHGPTDEDVGPLVDGFLPGQPTKIELQGEGITWGDWRFPKPEIQHFDYGTPFDVQV